MRKKVIGYQLKENGKPLKCYKNGKLVIALENNNVFMRNVEIVKVFEGDIKLPCYIDSYSYRGNI